jgi:UDP-3-O-[3-hydroxymyristoyl] glucosamine N-acyltransferase
MQFSAAQLAQIINGTVEGDANATVWSFGKIEEANAGQISFLANPKYEEHLYTTQASIVIVNNNLELRQAVQTTLLRVEDAYSSFALLLDTYQKLMTQQLKGIQEPVYIDATARIGENVFIGAFAYIGEKVVVGKNSKIYPHVFLGDNVILGENCIIHAGAKIYHDCIVGNNVIIHAGTVIGADGFGFAPQSDGSFKKVPQIGNVIIENDVEIGANATIDRGTIGSTLIKSGAKLDNLLQIAHNVEVGNDTVIAAQVGISGSTKIGNKVMIGGQAGIVGHIQIADGTKINGQSGVSKSVKESNVSLTGSPAQDFTTSLRNQAMIKKLPDLEKRIKELEDKIAAFIKAEK